MTRRYRLAAPTVHCCRSQGYGCSRRGGHTPEHAAHQRAQQARLDRAVMEAMRAASVKVHRNVFERSAGFARLAAHLVATP